MPARNASPAVKSASREIHEGLRQIAKGLRRLGREAIKHAAAAGRPVRRKVSPGRRLHGQYIGLIRNLPAKDKARVRAVRAKQGVEAAIRMAKGMRKSQ